METLILLGLETSLRMPYSKGDIGEEFPKVIKLRLSSMKSAD